MNTARAQSASASDGAEADDQVARWLRPAKAALAVKGDDLTH
jgi:hypothetical protein